jgi:hypothetical protein
LEVIRPFKLFSGKNRAYNGGRGVKKRVEVGMADKGQICRPTFKFSSLPSKKFFTPYILYIL